MSPKAQVTLMMVLGFGILLLASLLFYSEAKVETKQLKEEEEIIHTTSAEVGLIHSYVQKCFENMVEKSVELLGKQAGFLYRSQGGPISDIYDSYEGQLFVNHDNHKVSFLIYPPRTVGAGFTKDPPDYPFPTFPYKNLPNLEEDFIGFYGLNALLPLLEADGTNSFQYQLEQYAVNNLDTCLDFAIFDEQGYIITLGERSLSIIPGDEEIIATLTLPLNIIYEVTSEQTQIDTFKTILPVRLGLIHEFLNDLFEQETTDISYDILSVDQSEFGLSVVPSVNGNDDLFILKDKTMQLAGSTYEFWFARKNRPPALYYLESPTLEIPENTHITKSLLSSHIGTEQAIDPDEDTVEFFYTLPDVPGDPDIGASPFQLVADETLRVSVEDEGGEFSDYQEFDMETFAVDEIDASSCFKGPQGCYDNGGNILASIRHSEFKHYLSQAHCDHGVTGCVCPAGSSSSVTPITDPDTQEIVCDCITGSQWTGSNCCGDDNSDCGQITGKNICTMNSAGTFSQQINAGTNPYGIITLECNNREVLAARGTEWMICDSARIERFNLREFYCTGGTGWGSWKECCGNTNCLSSGDGQRLVMGEEFTSGGTTYFCTSRENFVTDLDDSNKITCEANSAGNDWTGNYCCGDENGEYYEDVQGCYNDKSYSSGDKVNSHVIFYDREFYGCGLTDTQKNHRDQQSPGSPKPFLIGSNFKHNADCYRMPDDDYFCSKTTNTWKDIKHFAECCPSGLFNSITKQCLP